MIDSTDTEFLQYLRTIAVDFRYSEELLGQIIRGRWPAQYPGTARQEPEANQNDR